MFDPHEYTITIKKVVLDNETWFEATVTELPEVAEYADSSEEVYKLAIDTIQTAMEMFAQEGRLFPPPFPRLSEEDYNGYISLQLPKFLYRDIAAAARQENLRVNEYILSTLSYTMGLKHASVVTKNPLLSLNKLKPKAVTKSHQPLSKLSAIKSSGMMRN